MHDGGKNFKRKKYILIAANIVVLIAIVGVVFGIYENARHHKHINIVIYSNSSKPKTNTQTSQANQLPYSGVTLDSTKDYGNKYSNGELPVGDGKYSTTSAQVGSIYACSQYAQNLSSNQGGAQTRGPWFTNNNTEYNINQKVHVQGSVMWQASFSNNISGNTRVITTNDLPNSPTGTFPISASDPAYQYDHNPNTIAAQSLTYNLNANPTYGNPQCMSGDSGIMLTGVAIFNGFDAGGRDAGAWEVQDGCQGHPQSSGLYHYHTLSSCIKDVSVQTVIGFALDGFPITGPQVGANSYLTTSDLDVCHGIISQINLDGKTVNTYHYVMTQDFPYSVSCFRGTPITPPTNVKAGSTSTRPPQGP